MKKPTSLALSIILLQIMAWIHLIGFVIFLGLSIYGWSIFTQMEFNERLLFILSVGSLMGFFLLYFFTAKGLIHGKKWARIVTIIVGGLMLFAFPVGTTIGVLLLYGTTKGWPIQVLEETNKLEKTN